MPQANDYIGPYQLIRKLGAGGFGEVWLARDSGGSTPREVAVKMPLESEIDLDALLQEATVWARATGHPNVLEFLAARVFDGQVALVSEYAPDGSLKEWLRRHGGRAPSIEVAVEMTRGILAGLEHLHGRSIIHRDIKPENVLLLGATPRLADFGISRVLISTSKSAVTAGTPLYMAPEAFNRKRNQQTDLWSVGVMLYRMLSGRLPFKGNDMAELYGAILNEEPDPLPADVPKRLRRVVAKALIKEPERRYQTAAEMRAALTPQPQPVRAPPAPPPPRRTETVDEPPPKPKPIVIKPQPPEPKPIVAYPPPPKPVPPAPQGDRSSKWLKNLLSNLLAMLIMSAIIVLVNYWRSIWPISSFTTGSATNNTAPQPSFTTGSAASAGQSFTENLNGVKLEMIGVPGGSFLMGSPDSEVEEGVDAEGPQHSVTVQAFSIGKYEITQAQWKAVMGGNNPSYFKGDNLPVEIVSWNEAREFCQKLAQMTGKRYGLPSEAEWEYACRAGTTTPFAFGSSLSSNQANFDGNSPYGGAAKGVWRSRTTPVGSFSPNAFGLHDMHGNVGEWCEDVIHDNYNGAPTDGSAWLSGGDSSHRVLRGGTWYLGSSYVRSSSRNSSAPGERDRSLMSGFRVAVSARTQ